MLTHTLSTYTNRIRLFRRDARLYLLYLALSGVAGGIFSLLLNFYILSLGHDQAVLGEMLTANSSAALLGALPAGYLSDRVGRRRALLLAGLGSVAGVVGIAFARGTAVLLILFILLGLAQSLSGVTMAPFLLENSDELERTYLFSASFGVQMLTVTIGYALGGRLPGWIGRMAGIEATGAAAYGWGLTGVAAVTALALAPLLLVRSSPPSASHRPAAWLAPLRQARRSAPLLSKLILPILITTLGAGLFVPFMNLFFRQRFQSSDATIGTLFAAGSLAMGIGLLLAPLWSERYGKARLFIVAQALSIPFMFLLGFAPWFWLSALAYLARILLMNMAIPIYQAFAMEQIEEEGRGTAAALLNMGYSFGYAVSPALSGRIQAQAGFAPIFAVAIASYIVAIFLYWRFFWRPAGPASLAAPAVH
jgi:MFS family permease